MLLYQKIGKPVGPWNILNSEKNKEKRDMYGSNLWYKNLSNNSWFISFFIVSCVVHWADIHIEKCALQIQSFLLLFICY